MVNLSFGNILLKTSLKRKADPRLSAEYLATKIGDPEPNRILFSKTSFFEYNKYLK